MHNAVFAVSVLVACVNTAKYVVTFLESGICIFIWTVYYDIDQILIAFCARECFDRISRSCCEVDMIHENFFVISAYCILICYNKSLICEDIFAYTVFIWTVVSFIAASLQGCTLK